MNEDTMTHTPDMCAKCGKYHHDHIAHRDTDPSHKIDLGLGAGPANDHMDTLHDITPPAQDEIITLPTLPVKW